MADYLANFLFEEFGFLFLESEVEYFRILFL